MTESPVAHNRGAPSPGARFSITGRLAIDGQLVDGALVIEGGRIVELHAPVGGGALPRPRIDADIVSPGLVDLQVNGAFGFEVGAGPDALRALAARLPVTGTTTFLPAIISRPPSEYAALAGAWAQARAAGASGVARMPGLHLEGPLLAPDRAGAHDQAVIAAATAPALEAALGPMSSDPSPGHPGATDSAIALVTLAPERPGALALVERLRAAGVAVSLGHSDADYDQALAAFDAGASLVTHLWSAMAPFHHRAPGLAGAALTDERAVVMVIADGVHAHPAALKLAHAAKGWRGVALCSDAVASAGMPPGRYALGGAPIVSDGQSARRPDGTLAGSLLTMDAAVRNMVTLGGVPVAEALAMASSVPARAIGLLETGRLAVGAPADLTLWSADLTVQATIVDAEIVYRRQ